MHLHIFASLHGYPGKWARMLDEGKDISVQDLLMHMEKTFGNKCDYDTMIRTLYEAQQRDSGGVHAPHTRGSRRDTLRIPEAPPRQGVGPGEGLLLSCIMPLPP